MKIKKLLLLGIMFAGLTACTEPVHEHDFAELRHDETHHWYECECGEKDNIELHTFDEGVIVLAATEDEDGLILYTCEICGYENEMIIPSPIHEHVFDKLRHDDTHHWYECGCGAKGEAEVHTYDDGEVTLPPTENDPGIMTYTCIVCNYQKEGEIPPLSHVHDFGDVLVFDENAHWFECECGARNDIEEHHYDQGVVTLAPTTESPGVMTYTCLECGRSYTQEIPILSSLDRILELLNDSTGNFCLSAHQEYHDGEGDNPDNEETHTYAIAGNVSSAASINAWETMYEFYKIIDDNTIYLYNYEGEESYLSIELETQVNALHYSSIYAQLIICLTEGEFDSQDNTFSLSAPIVVESDNYGVLGNDEIRYDTAVISFLDDKIVIDADLSYYNTDNMEECITSELEIVIDNIGTASIDNFPLYSYSNIIDYIFNTASANFTYEETLNYVDTSGYSSHNYSYYEIDGLTSHVQMSEENNEGEEYWEELYAKVDLAQGETYYLYRPSIDVAWDLTTEDGYRDNLFQNHGAGDFLRDISPDDLIHEDNGYSIDEPLILHEESAPTWYSNVILDTFAMVIDGETITIEAQIKYVDFEQGMDEESISTYGYQIQIELGTAVCEFPEI